jgi:hypothetical protein
LAEAKERRESRREAFKSKREDQDLDDSDLKERLAEAKERKEARKETRREAFLAQNPDLQKKIEDAREEKEANTSESGNN